GVFDQGGKSSPGRERRKKVIISSSIAAAVASSGASEAMAQEWLPRTPKSCSTSVQTFFSSASHVSNERSSPGSVRMIDWPNNWATEVGGRREVTSSKARLAAGWPANVATTSNFHGSGVAAFAPCHARRFSGESVKGSSL